MKEYWVNVYDDYANGRACRSREDAEEACRLVLKIFEAKTLYRIHVRLK